MKVTADSNFVAPAGWSGWDHLVRMQWLEAEGLAADFFEAMALLQARGEWPTREELGMIAGVARPQRDGRKRAAHHDRVAVPVQTVGQPVPPVCSGRLGDRYW